MLARNFAARRDDAFREVYERHRDHLHEMAYRMLGERELADDAIQLTFLRAWQAAGAFDPRRPLEPWLYAIARRAAIDIGRRQRGGDVQLSRLEAEVFEQADQGDDDTASRLWLRHEVHVAIGKLRPSDQTVVRLVFLADHTHSEAAAKLGIPIGTVKSRLFRAQRKMTVLLRHLDDAVHA